MSSADTYGSGETNGEDGSSSGDEWLSDAKNYDGTVTDLTGKKSVTVDVGPEDHPYAFTPLAIRISPSTTVVWKWIGSGYHNIVAKNDQFESGEPEQNATFEYTFETAGTFEYYCDPHKSMGMKGAVIVTGSGTNASVHRTAAADAKIIACRVVGTNHGAVRDRQSVRFTGYDNPLG